MPKETLPTSRGPCCILPLSLPSIVFSPRPGWSERAGRKKNAARTPEEESTRTGETCTSRVPSMENINGGMRGFEKGEGNMRLRARREKLGQPNTLRPELESRERIRGRSGRSSFRRFYFRLRPPGPSGIQTRRCCVVLHVFFSSPSSWVPSLPSSLLAGRRVADYFFHRRDWGRPFPFLSGV